MPCFGTCSVLRTAVFSPSDASCERFLLNVPGSLLVQGECCHCHSDFHWKVSLKAFSSKVTWILMSCPHRKVEDLQFRVEEESITKGDLEVKYLQLCKENTRECTERQESLKDAILVQLHENDTQFCSRWVSQLSQNIRIAPQIQLHTLAKAVLWNGCNYSEKFVNIKFYLLLLKVTTRKKIVLKLRNWKLIFMPLKWILKTGPVWSIFWVIPMLPLRKVD